jgi:hypothetical protein
LTKTKLFFLLTVLFILVPTISGDEKNSWIFEYDDRTYHTCHILQVTGEILHC